MHNNFVTSNQQKYNKQPTHNGTQLHRVYMGANVKDCLAIYYNKHEIVIILIHKNKLATTQEL